MAYIFLKDIITNTIMGLFLSITAGIMIYISIFELLPVSLKYNNKYNTFKYFILGIIIVILTHYIV